MPYMDEPRGGRSLRTRYTPTDVRTEVPSGAYGGGVGAGGGGADWTGAMQRMIQAKLNRQAVLDREAARDRAYARNRQKQLDTESDRERYNQGVLANRKRMQEEYESYERQPMRTVQVGTQTFYTPETQGLTAKQRKKFLPEGSQMTVGPDEARGLGAQARGAEEAEFQRFGRSSAERIGRAGGPRKAPKKQSVTKKPTGETTYESEEGWE
jgi:hypothetical protein